MQLKFMAEWVHKEQYGDKGGKKPEAHVVGQSAKMHEISKASHDHGSHDAHKYAQGLSRPKSRDSSRGKNSKSNENSFEAAYHKPEMHSDDEEEEGDEVMDLDTMLKQKQAENKVKTANRTSVSAEVYGKFNKKENFKARVIPKSVDEKKKIREKLLMSFLFRALDEKDLETCIDAMEIKKLK